VDLPVAVGSWFALAEVDQELCPFPDPPFVACVIVPVGIVTVMRFASCKSVEHSILYPVGRKVLNPWMREGWALNRWETHLIMPGCRCCTTQIDVSSKWRMNEKRGGGKGTVFKRSASGKMGALSGKEDGLTCTGLKRSRDRGCTPDLYPWCCRLNPHAAGPGRGTSSTVFGTGLTIIPPASFEGVMGELKTETPPLSSEETQLVLWYQEQKNYEPGSALSSSSISIYLCLRAGGSTSSRVKVNRQTGGESHASMMAASEAKLRNFQHSCIKACDDMIMKVIMPFSTIITGRF
jgi:hypothetical protein